MGHEGCALWVHWGLCSSAWKCCTCWERGKSSFPWGAVLRAAAPHPPSEGTARALGWEQGLLWCGGLPAPLAGTPRLLVQQSSNSTAEKGPSK